VSIVDTFVHRNRTFAGTRFDRRLRMRPGLSTIVIGCFDPRVDPVYVLGAEQGEIGVLRNVGGRVTPRTIEQLLMLREVARATGSSGFHNRTFLPSSLTRVRTGRGAGA
jgi:carbonic anhydrase